VVIVLIVVCGLVVVGVGWVDVFLLMWLWLFIGFIWKFDYWLFIVVLLVGIVGMLSLMVGCINVFVGVFILVMIVFVVGNLVFALVLWVLVEMVGVGV